MTTPTPSDASQAVELQADKQLDELARQWANGAPIVLCYDGEGRPIDGWEFSMPRFRSAVRAAIAQDRAARAQAEPLPSPSRDLAELILHMEMATEKGKRARQLARQVLAGQDEALRVLRLIQHATAPSPDDGGAHECAYELAAAGIKALTDLPSPPAARAQGAGEAVSQAARDVLTERARQVGAEGWTPEHDDEHWEGDLSLAGAVYAVTKGPRTDVPPAWPWEAEAFKPRDWRRNLVKAGALILAELERLDRAASAACGDPMCACRGGPCAECPEGREIAALTAPTIQVPGFVPEGFWLAPMVPDASMVFATAPGAAVTTTYLALRDSWLARHPAAPTSTASAPKPADRDFAIERFPELYTGAPKAEGACDGKTASTCRNQTDCEIAGRCLEADRTREGGDVVAERSARLEATLRDIANLQGLEIDVDLLLPVRMALRALAGTTTSEGASHG